MKIHRAEGIGKTWFIRTSLNNASGIIAQFPVDLHGAFIAPLSIEKNNILG
jgi:hypothetical protein